MENQVLVKNTPLKSIRLKCLDCCAGSWKEVELCTCSNCALWPYRFGKNPNRAGKGGFGHRFEKQMDSTDDFSEYNSENVEVSPNE